MSLALCAIAVAVVFLGFEVRKGALALTSTLKGQTDMASEALARITAEVSEIKTAAESAVALIGSLAQQIRDNATDPVALNALADELDTTSTALAAAVTANTPDAPVPADPAPADGTN